MAAIPALAARASLELGYPEPYLRVYLEERIRYRLAAPEKVGLHRFLCHAAALFGGSTTPEAACSSSSSFATTPR
jgi:hypothetical protein